MLVWILAAWILLSVGLAVVHYRVRSIEAAMPPEVEEFLIRFETVLARRHPAVDYLGLLPGRFACLLRIDGQETPIDLENPFRHALAFPDAIEQTIDRLVQEIQEVGLDRVTDHDFAAVATSILPQVRSREWLDRHGRFGDGGLVSRVLADQLIVVYVIDDPHSMVFVTRRHLAQWRKEENEVFHLAVGNLRRLGNPSLERIGSASAPLLLQTGDGYDAARVLLLEQAEGLLVAMPDRDVLWVGPEQGQDLATLMATTSDIARDAAHPVSGELFRFRNGRLEPLAPER
jgi:uncharacterized protein YtpQ (UPF0354 family)